MRHGGYRLPEDTEAHILFNSYLQAGAQLMDDDDESSYRLSEASRNLAEADRPVRRLWGGAV